MADIVTTQSVATQGSGPTSAEAFIADRQMFWTRFTHFVVFVAGAIALLLIGLAVFVA